MNNVNNVFKKYLNILDQKSKILKENKNKSGIYCWYNNCTDKFYIGSSNNLNRRINFYLSFGSLNKAVLKIQSIIYY